MTSESPEVPVGDDDTSVEERERERRRLAEIFGDVLPESTRDDQASGEDVRDAEILRDVPPHHT